MKTVIKIQWWRFWRKRWFGLNPFRWNELKSIDMSDSVFKDITVHGHNKPFDGGGGWFVFYDDKNGDLKKDLSSDYITQNNNNCEPGAWVRMSKENHLVYFNGEAKK